MAFWISTGARASELLGMLQCDVYPGQQLISVVRKGSGPGSSSGLSRCVRVAAAVSAGTAEARDSPREDPAGLVDAAPPARPLTYHAAHRMFERVNAALGADWTLHDLRHSAAARMARDPQLSLADVQWVMGHAHLTTTELYLTPGNDEVIAGVLAHTPASPGSVTCRAPGTRL